MKKILLLAFAFIIGCKGISDNINHAIKIQSKPNPDDYHVIVKEMSMDNFYNMQPDCGVACIGCHKGHAFTIQYTKDNWKTNTFMTRTGKFGGVQYLGFTVKQEAIDAAQKIKTLELCLQHEKKIDIEVSDILHKQDSAKAAYEQSLITIIK